LFDLESRFFAPTHARRTPTRAGAVKIGRRSGVAPFSTVARPHLYGAEHGGKLMVVGMKFEGSPLSGTRTLVPQPCIRWITPYHDACMRIGGEAPRWWTHS
jgi:hypothetical protein